MSIFVDFLGYLASAAWLSGNAVREGKERKKAEKLVPKAKKVTPGYKKKRAEQIKKIEKQISR